MPALPKSYDTDIAGLRTDVAVAALRDALKDGWSVLALAAGIADALADQLGIGDLGGATYDAAGKYLHNPGGWSANLANGGTALSGGDYGGCPAANAFDGNDATAWNSDVSAGSVANAAYIGYQFAAATGLARLKVKWLASRMPTAATIDTRSAGVWTARATIAPANDTTLQAFDFSVSGSVDAVRLMPTTATVNNGYHEVATVEAYNNADPADVAAVSVAFAPDAAVSQVRLVALWEPVDAATLGVDCLLDVSADDGATWVNVPLADLGKYDGSARIVGGMAAAAGSSIKWRWRTANTKTQRLHGVWLQWR